MRIQIMDVKIRHLKKLEDCLRTMDPRNFDMRTYGSKELGIGDAAFHAVILMGEKCKESKSGEVDIPKNAGKWLGFGMCDRMIAFEMFAAPEARAVLLDDYNMTPVIMSDFLKLVRQRRKVQPWMWKEVARKHGFLSKLYEEAA